jgi:glycogen operon protein
LAYEVRSTEPLEHLYVALNAFWEALDFELPLPAESQVWRRVVDTALASPEDIMEVGQEPLVRRKRYTVGPRSVVVLEAR